MSKLIPTYIEQALRIEVLERAVIASEGDVEHLERELAEAQEELNDKRKFCYDVEQALDGLKGDYVEIIVAMRKDAEKYRYCFNSAAELAEAVTKERERCAKVCDEMDEAFVTIYGTDYTDFQNDPRYLQMAADAIRKGE